MPSGKCRLKIAYGFVSFGREGGVRAAARQLRELGRDVVGGVLGGRRLRGGARGLVAGEDDEVVGEGDGESGHGGCS